MNEDHAEDLQESIIPDVWIQQPKSSSRVMCLRAYKLSFDAIPADREYSSIALLLHLPLPKEAANFYETLELRHGKAVICKIEPLKNVLLDHCQVAQAEQFQSTLFTVLLDRSLMHSKTKELPISDGSWYLLLPLKDIKNLDPSENQEIDWDKIAKLKSFGDSKHAMNLTEIAHPKDDGAALHFSDGIINIQDVPGLLVETTYNKHLYCVIDMFTDLKADSPFPSNRFPTYAAYFESKHGCKVEHKGQHLLKARSLREADNFLLVRSRENDNGNKDTAEKFSEADKSTVELPPEVCSIKYSGFYDDLINTAVILPSLLHKLENILVAAQLRKFLSSKFPEGSVVSVNRVLQALTTPKCHDSFSLERLEFLGDSFLKYAISCHLFLVHEEAAEGFLSSQRDQKICNSLLFTLGCKFGLAGYIRDSLFDPKYWVAPCHPSKKLCDESKLGDLHGESTEDKGGKALMTCNKRHRWMQRKTIADATEALIGAYLEDGGENAALSFMDFIGLEVAIDTSQIAKIQSISMNNLSLMERIDIKTLEKLLSYRFKYKGLLIEAFTHPSIIGKCYQRLEFLGDSVLGFLITRHLYKEFEESKPGELTDLRSTIVSNQNFARIAIQHKLYKHLIENSVIVTNCIEQFVSNIHTSSEHGLFRDSDGERCPKVLGDIVESLTGAICVDSDFDLSLVWEVFEPILILHGNVRLQPVRELLEVCQKNHFDYLEKISNEDGRQHQCRFQIHVNNEVVNGAGIAKDKKSARAQAALHALATLKVLGYIHPYKCEALVSQRPTNMEDTSKKEQSGESQKSDTLQNQALGVNNVDEALNITSIKDKGKKPLCRIDEMKHGQKGIPFYSPQGRPTQSRLPADNSVWEQSITNVKNCKPDGGLQQSKMAPPEHSGTGPHLSEKNELGIRNETAAHMTMQAAAKGIARSVLNETCIKKGWMAPSFTCSRLEGPPHDKRFTYNVILDLESGGKMECTGSPSKDIASAKDSAAAKLLNQLDSEGYL